MAVNLRDQFDVTVDDGRSRLYNEEAEAAGMWAPTRSFRATRIGMDVNANNMDLAAARAAGRTDQAAQLAAENAQLQQRQGMHAPGVERVEDIGTKNGYLRDGLEWFGTQVGSGVASMAEPMAMAAGGALLSRVPGLRTAAPLAAGLGAFAFNQRQVGGSHYGRIAEDEQAMANLGDQGAYQQANVVGALGGAAATAVPWVVGRAMGGAALGKAASAMPGGSFLGKTAFATGGEGLSEIAEGEVGRVAHTMANPYRDKSKDNSERLNEGLGGMAGGTLPGAAGAAIDTMAVGANRTGEAVKDAAGTVRDLAAEQGARATETAKAAADKANVKQIFDLGVEKGKSIWESVTDAGAKVKDFMTGEDGRADYVGAFNKAQAEYERFKMDQEERDLLTAVLPEDIIDPAAKQAWVDDITQRKDDYLYRKMSELEAQGMEEAGPFLDGLESGDPVVRQTAIEQASEFLLERNSAAELQRQIAANQRLVGEGIARVAGLATRAARKAGEGAMFAGRAAAKGVADELASKKNKQGTSASLSEPLTYSAWRQIQGDPVVEEMGHAIKRAAEGRRVANATDLDLNILRRRQASQSRAQLFGEIMAAEAEAEASRQEARRGLASRVQTERSVTNPDGSRNIDGLANYARTLAYEISDMAESWAGHERTRDTVRAGTALNVLDAMAKDVRLTLRQSAAPVIQRMSEQADPTTKPFFDALLERVQRPVSPQAERAARQSVTDQMVALLPQKFQQELLRDGGTEMLFETVGAISRGRVTAGKRREIEEALGADTVNNLVMAYNGEFATDAGGNPLGETYVDDSLQVMGEGELNDAGEANYVTDDGDFDADGAMGGEISAWERSMKEKTAEMGSGPKIYGLNNDPKARTSPFEPSDKPSKEAVDQFRREERQRHIDMQQPMVRMPQKRPNLFQDEGYDEQGNPIEHRGFKARVAQMEKALGPDYSIDKRTALEVMDDRKIPTEDRLALYRDYMQAEMLKKEESGNLSEEDRADYEQMIDFISSGMDKARRYPKMWASALRNPRVAMTEEQKRGSGLVKERGNDPDAKMRETLIADMEDYFRSHYMAVAERRIDRDPTSPEAMEVRELTDKARKAVSSIRKNGEDITKANIIWFDTGTRDKNGNVARVPVRADDLVSWYRKAKAKGEEYSAPDDYSNRVRDESFLKDLSGALAAFVNVPQIKESTVGGPYMEAVGTDGKIRRHQFNKGVPPTLQLETSSYSGYQFGRKNNRRLTPGLGTDAAEMERMAEVELESLKQNTPAFGDGGWKDAPMQEADASNEGTLNPFGDIMAKFTAEQSKTEYTKTTERAEDRAIVKAKADEARKQEAAEARKIADDYKALRESLIAERLGNAEQSPATAHLQARAQAQNDARRALPSMEVSPERRAAIEEGVKSSAVAAAAAAAANKKRGTPLTGAALRKQRKHAIAEKVRPLIDERRGGPVTSADPDVLSLKATRVAKNKQDLQVHRELRRKVIASIIGMENGPERRAAERFADSLITDMDRDSEQTIAEKIDLEVRSGGGHKVTAGLGRITKLNAERLSKDHAALMMAKFWRNGGPNDAASREASFNRGLQGVTNRLRVALAPEYNPDTGVVGGIHYIWPLTHLLTAEMIGDRRKLTPAQSKTLVMARSAVAHAIASHPKLDVAVKMRMLKNMYPENQRARITTANFMTILDTEAKTYRALLTERAAKANAAPEVAAPEAPKSQPPQDGAGNKARGTYDNPIVGDLWAQPGVKVVSTNLGGVHGRGLAKQAKDKGLITAENRDFDSSPEGDVITLAVKGHAPETANVPGRAFSERVTGKNIDLLKSELRKLIRHARSNPDTNFYLPYVGLGFGEGDAAVIGPLLEVTAREPNIHLVAKDQSTVDRYASSFVPGVRRDATTRGSKLTAAEAPKSQPPQDGAGNKAQVTVNDHKSSGYRDRTKFNADSADMTVAIAKNFSTAGERLTKSVAGDRYMKFEFGDARADGRALAQEMQRRGATSLNVAGNGIYTLAQHGMSQAQVNQHIFDMLSEAHAAHPLTKIVSGGQTGVDIAGAVAARALGIPATITLPNGFVQRNAAGQDLRLSRAEIERQIEEGAAALRKRKLNAQGTADPRRGAQDDGVAPKRKLSLLSTQIHNDLQRPGFAATHDSPIRHEGKFNWRRFIGTGEGNAAFGAGTYLSTAEGVHKSYKSQFTAQVIGDDRFKGLVGMHALDVLGRMRAEMPSADMDRVFFAAEAELDDLASSAPAAKRPIYRLALKDIRTDRSAYEQALNAKSPTYEVSVNIKPEELLDWDAPLSEQSELVREALEGSAISPPIWEEDWGEHYAIASDGSTVTLVPDDGGYAVMHRKDNLGTFPTLEAAKKSAEVHLARHELELRAGDTALTGETVYKGLTERLGSQAAASDYLQNLGILGHKYAANGGRNDTHPNYVIYDDSKITTNYVRFNKQGTAGQSLARETLSDMSSLKNAMNSLGFRSTSKEFSSVAEKLLVAPDEDIDLFLKQSARGLSYLLMEGETGDRIKEMLDGDYWQPLRIKVVAKLRGMGLMRGEALVAAYREITRMALAKEIRDRNIAARTFVGRVIQMAKDVVSKMRRLTGAEQFQDLVRNSLNELVARNAGPIDLKANYRKVVFQDAVDADPQSARVLASVSRLPGAMLTGSIVLATYGPMYRDAANMLHDLDILVPNRTAAQKFLTREFPNAVPVYDFKVRNAKIDTYIVPPPGTEVQNIVREYGDKGRVQGYEVVRDGKVVGKMWNDKEGEHKSGEAATLVDLMSDHKGKAAKLVPFKVDGKTHHMTVADASHIFDQKLEMLRPKDIGDYRRFVPDAGRKFNKQGAGKPESEQIVDGMVDRMREYYPDMTDGELRQMAIDNLDAMGETSELGRQYQAALAAEAEAEAGQQDGMTDETSPETPADGLEGPPEPPQGTGEGQGTPKAPREPRKKGAGGRKKPGHELVAQDDPPAPSPEQTTAIAQRVAEPRATDEDIQKARDYVKRVLGDQVRADFEEITGYSGEWIEAEDVIKISTLTNAGILNVTRHEALHAFFSKFIANNPKAVAVFRSLTDDPRIISRLEYLLRDEPAALEQLADGEERLAYIYQFAMAGQLKLPYSPGKTLMEKVRKFLRRVFMMVRNDERAIDLLYAFERGEFNTPSAGTRALARHMNQGTWMTKGARTIDGFSQWTAAAVLPAATILQNSASPAARKLARVLVTNPGEDGSAAKGHGYLNDRNMRMRQYNNLFRGAIDGLDAGQMTELVEVMQRETPDDAVTDPDVLKARQHLRVLFDRFHKYMTKEKGVRLGRIKENYFPVVWDANKLRENPEGFKGMLLGKYRDKIEKIVASLEEARQKWISRAKTPEDRVLREATLPVSAETYVQSIYDAIIGNEGVDDAMARTPKRQDGVLRPWMSAAEKRLLDFIKPEDRAPFMEKDLIHIVTRYVRQGVRTAEYTSRFGRTGARLARTLQTIEEELNEAGDKMVAAGDLKAKDREKWVKRQYRDVANAVGAMEGSLGNDVSDTVRKINSWAIVYQNVRVLPLALFSSFVDPLGIVVRGGEMRDAWSAFTRGIKSVVGQWGDMLRDEAKPKQKDHWEKLAELAGVIDSATFSHLLTDEYASVYLDGRAKKINEFMFKANGMEAWNRSMRISATKAAVKFMEAHNKGESVHSERWMRDLGFEPGQLPLDVDGNLITNKRVMMSQFPGISEDTAEAMVEKVHKAINRWVEGAILSPNASQRPAWGSDPRFSMFWHLKQFAYSFHETILKRAVGEAKQGNVMPLGVLAWYIPTMIVADVVKGMAVNGGSLPDYMKSYDMSDWMMHGIDRSGVLGAGNVALDGMQDPWGIAGPAVEQIADSFTNPLQQNIINALPANALYKGMLI